LFLGLGRHWNPTDGRIAFYRNNGSSEVADMDSVTSFFLGIDVGDDAIPSFCDIDNDGDYDLFIGTDEGSIHFYRNTGTPEIYNFVLESDNYFNIDVGLIASPSFCDIDGDGDYDLFVGNRSWGEDNTHGDVYFNENTGTAEEADFELKTQNFVGIDVGVGCTPTFTDINNDGLDDMFIGEGDGNINYFSNIGTESEPAFSLTENTFQNIWATYQSRPTFGDLDGDGDLDMIVSKCSYINGSLSLYRNNGTPEAPDFELVNGNYLGRFLGIRFPRLVDIDADGDLDLFMGTDSNRVLFYENQGDPTTPDFVLVDDNFLNTPLQVSERCAISFGDMDGDGDYDLIRGHMANDAYLTFYRNIGTAQVPNLILEEDHFLDISLINMSEPYLEDIDHDGDLDLFVGDFCGGVSFWRNNEISWVAGRPPEGALYEFVLRQNYPNPFNPTTIISFTLNKALPVKLSIYNQLGQQVSTIIDNQVVPGNYQYTWDAAQFSSGIYYISLESPEQKQTQKVILLK